MVVSGEPDTLAPGQNHRHPLTRRWMGPRANLDVLEKKKNSLAPAMIQSLEYPTCCFVTTNYAASLKYV